MMSFVFPGFLFALFAVLLPVIIHLFRFRRLRKVYFPNTAFLRQLREAHRRQSQLKHLLVLLARMLAIAFLVLAFARPFVPAQDMGSDPAGNAVGVYIDNSFSMSALSPDGGCLLDRAVASALDVAAAYRPGDRFMLITNDFEGRHQRFVSREEFEIMVEEVDYSARSRSIARVMTRMAGLFSGEPGSRRAYFISDFQKSTSGIDALEPDTALISFFVPLQALPAGNLFVDSCWVDSPVRLPGQPVSMQLRLRNEGSQDLQGQPLRLYIDGVRRTVTSFDIQAGGVTEIQLSWTAGDGPVEQGHVEVLDHPVNFDDRMYFSVEVSPRIPVLGLEGNGQNPYVRALFGNNDLFLFETMPAFSIDYDRFSDFDLVVMTGFDRLSAGLSAELQRFVQEGGSLILFPGAGAELPSYSAFLSAMEADAYNSLETVSQRVISLNEQHPIFEGVFEEVPDNIDLPAVSRYFAIEARAASAGETLLWLQNGLPFMISYPQGEGSLLLSSVPLQPDFSNLPHHSVFVPVMVNAALQSRALQPLYHPINSELSIGVAPADAQANGMYVLSNKSFEVIPEQRRTRGRTLLFFHDQIGRAGNYRLLLGEEEAGGLSFNYDRRESLLASYDIGALRDLLSDYQLHGIHIMDTHNRSLGQLMQEMEYGMALWHWCLLFALGFMLLEVLLLRFWK